MTFQYDSLALEYQQNRKVQLQLVSSLISIGALDASAKVLDVGCGTGNYIVALEKATGCSCWGIDPSEGMLSIARGRTFSANFQQGQAEHLDLPTSYFDMVFSVDVIHHMTDCESYFREAFRVLKSGGRLMTVTDSEDIIRRRQPLSAYFPETIELELLRYPGIAELRTLMLQVGYQDLQETIVESPYSLFDSRPFRDKAFSCLHLISSDDFAKDLEHLEQDLQSGPIPCVSRYHVIWASK